MYEAIQARPSWYRTREALGRPQQTTEASQELGATRIEQTGALLGNVTLFK
jgi:hypothetical protein